MKNTHGIIVGKFDSYEEMNSWVANTQGGYLIIFLTSLDPVKTHPLISGFCLIPFIIGLCQIEVFSKYYYTTQNIYQFIKKQFII